MLTADDQFSGVPRELFRRRGERLRRGMAHTVAAPDEVERELRFLVRAWHPTTGDEA